MSEQIAGDWILASLNGQAVPPPPAKTDRVPSLSITRDGAVSGFAGVNRFAGTTEPAALNRGEVTLDRLAATKMAGPEPANRFEMNYLAALAQAKSFRVAGQRLEFLNAAGSPVAAFTRK
jgi:heat shock protein HslJ